jgi:carboxypeptidase Taq
MSFESSYAELMQRMKEHTLLGSCSELLSWDEQTYMPHNGAPHRGAQKGLLARLRHETLTAPRTRELLTELEASPLAKGDTIEAANVREVRRVYDRAVKLPGTLVEAIARTASEAHPYWVEARKTSNFALFLPWLEKIVALKREEADAVGHQGVPYDALLDEYEPGARTADIARLFTALQAELAPLVTQIVASGRRPRADILEREYPVGPQYQFGHQTAAVIGFDFEAGRLDTTTHPFCCGIGPGDCRITTRYNPHHFNESFFGILHEAGHGLYEQGLDPQYFGTAAGSFASLGIHESQSRLWENQVGRSRAFWDFFFPRAREFFPTTLADVSLDDFFFAINDVRRSFIRVEADEATYNLHIVLRFELEQALVSGDLPPREVPAAWNEKFTKLFGLTPATDAEGCLQDIHWSGGGIGYFPTYTLGNLYAAQFMEQARTDLTDLDSDFRRGAFARLKGWLNEKVHRPGHRYDAGELCRRVTGRALSPQPFLAYLRGKYGPLYGL